MTTATGRPTFGTIPAGLPHLGLGRDVCSFCGDSPAVVSFDWQCDMCEEDDDVALCADCLARLVEVAQ